MREVTKFLFIFFILLASCSESEDNESIGTIVGIWQYEYSYKDGTDILNDCTRQTTVEFTIDNMLFIDSYDVDETDNCILARSSETTWEKDETRKSWYCFPSGVCEKYVLSNGNNTLTLPGNPAFENPDEWRLVLKRIK